jgi:potassium-transporting ATPase KdpC subunit
MSLKKELGRIPSPAIRLAVISMILCGLLFPLIVTGFAQVLFPGQAGGSIAHLGTKGVGSYLIAQNFSKPEFFHPRNSSLSASAVDPDILLQDAQVQVGRISNATGISQADINGIINQNIEGTFWAFGYPYVNVLKLNLALVQEHQTIYKQLDPKLFQ